MKILPTLLFCALCLSPAVLRGDGSEKAPQLTVRTVRDRSVYRIGETVRFIFTLTGPDGKPGAGKELKMELWLDGKYFLRTCKTDETGRIQANIRPEQQCLVRCRAEYTPAVFAVGSATFSRAPLAVTPYKLRMKGRSGKVL